MVPFVRIKLHMSILLGWIIINSSSACSFIRLPNLPYSHEYFWTREENWKSSRAGVHALQNHIEHNQRVAHQKLLVRAVLHSKDVCRESFLVGDFWLMHQFCRNSITHTTTFQHFGNHFVGCHLYASHLAVASSLPSQFWYLLEKHVLLDRDSSDSNTPELQKQCYNDNKFRQHWSNQFYFVYQ